MSQSKQNGKIRTGKNSMKINTLTKYAFVALTAALALVSFGPSARAGFVNLGAAGDFGALALTHGIDTSGPIGPNGQYTFAGNVGVAGTGQKFQSSGDVSMAPGTKLYLSTGNSMNSSAKGVPQPEPQNAANDAFLNQARNDAFAASTFAAGLAPTATYGTINSNLTISEAAVGNYVFNINSINFSGGKELTLNAPAGSTYTLNISGSIVLTDGSILVSGGLTAADVLINYTGTNVVQFSGGGNSSQVYGTILAPYAEVGLHPGFVAGSVIADKITLSSGGQIGGMTVVPEMNALFPVFGLAIAVGSTHLLRRRALRKSNAA
jgi:choice-of-anchor A domain-containing protein